MPDEPTEPPELPDDHAEILQLLEPRLALFECHLRYLSGGCYDIVDNGDERVLGEVVDDLALFAATNG